MMPDDLSSRGLTSIVVEVISLLITLNILSLIGNTLVCIAICKNARLRFALCCVCDAHKRERIDSRQLDFRRNALPTLRLLQPVCYLRFSCSHGFKSFKSLCEDRQVGSAVQETVFSEKVARFACLRVIFRCMLHGGSVFKRTNSF